MSDTKTQRRTGTRPGLPEDGNRNGIPDQYEGLMRIVGWVGRFAGDPQLKDRFERQLRAHAETALGQTPPAKGRAHAPPHTRPPARVSATTSCPPTSVVERISREPRTESRLSEFLRKLVIVSSVVIAGYAALRLLGFG